MNSCHMKLLFSVIFGNCFVEHFSIMSATMQIVTCLLGFDSIQSLWQALSYVLYEPMTVQSNGSYLCDVWCSSVSKIMPFSLATFMVQIYKWDSWLSKTKRNVSSLEGLSHVTQYFMQSTNSLSHDQTVGFALLVEAVRAPVEMQLWKYRHWRNMVTNGIYSNNHCDIYLSLPCCHTPQLL